MMFGYCYRTPPYRWGLQGTVKHDTCTVRIRLEYGSSYGLNTVVVR